jgi:hypothetical protein
MLAVMSERPISTDEDASSRADQWLSASETRRLVRMHTDAFYASQTIAKRAFAGLLRARASLFMAGNKSQKDSLIPKEFWWAGGEAALTANWEIGDFETWIDRRLHCRAFGVQFHAGDLQEMIPEAFKSVAPPEGPPSSATGKVGRPPAEWWDDLWIEICRRLYVGDLQPKRQADIENAMNDWVAANGSSAAPSTVRSRARKLWRSIGNEDEK